ncbi:adenylate cyclase [Rhizobium laguerreae]|uniref:adenylate cyclase n=1 Tax=Rhizobium laguerreae TaxID=1076926 RepID=UPI001C9036CE|nr:adenylate cyclase [Rhizobium laguerreae]MBY3194846.1 adenylate cyclase [Rhizobium laguerreae]MBY3226199.1 adenylate cyclase [Rhizobium laguerreae]MBY3556204.1 adenylate cyclase [Rhizobium laguerreae]
MQTSVPLPDDRAERPCPTHEEVRAQLERILSSREFPSAGRGAAFLKYVTEETLAGRAQRLKAYSIAIEVFNRSAGFSQEDPVVRIEAGRLRRVIERYYLVAGQRDPIRIDIPKGGYVPTFTWNDAWIEAAGDAPNEDVAERRVFAWRRLAWPVLAMLVAFVCAGLGYYAGVLTGPAIGRSAGQVPGEPTLVIAPFADLGDGPQAARYAAGLTEELLTALPRFKEITVFGRETSKALPPGVEASQVREGLGARYLVAGGVRVAGDKVRVTVRLVDTTDGSILWSQDYDENLDTHELFVIQTDVASKVATAIAQPYGIIARSLAANPPPDDAGVHDCTLRFYAYREELNPETHLIARNCLQNAVARFPGYSTAWSMLSFIHLDEGRFEFNPQRYKGPAMERALGSARRAVSLEPDNTRALQALMTALFFNNETKEAFEVGEAALAANPNDTEFLGELGTRVAFSGQWKRGAELLDRAIELNPGGAGYYFGTRALIACMLDDHEMAVRLIRKADLQKFPLFHGVAAVIYSEAGLLAEAKREGEVFMKMRPDYLPNIVDENRKRNLPPKDSMRMIAALRRAGLPVPSATDVEAEFRLSDAYTASGTRTLQ